jgi:hypothetical protein
MSPAEVFSDLEAWLFAHMRQGQRFIPARLLTLLGLLERLRETPVLSAAEHCTASGAQLVGHDAAVQSALDRFSLQSPVEARGRRANNLNAWANPFFKWLDEHGFRRLSSAGRQQFITDAQTVIARQLEAINSDKPLVARYHLGAAVAVLADILDQAQQKRRAKDVAEYLVGAKLELRYGLGEVSPKSVNTPSGASLADFRYGNLAFEVTVLPRSDDAHLSQLRRILENTNIEVWLLVRRTDRERWQQAITMAFADMAGRVVVTDIETFVGQNITEIGRCDIAEVRDTLRRLFDRYCRHWLPRAGSSGLRIIDLSDVASNR